MWPWWAALATKSWASPLALLALCLVIYLPSGVRLPAVDRTEIIWSETTRDMVDRWAWIDPRYGSMVHQYRPIGTFWAQGASRWLAGNSHDRNIIVYRIPSVLAVTLAVLALFWLGQGLVGSETALIASALFAVAPLTVLVAQLAIAEGLSLLPATIAMLALARVYVNAEESIGTALLFWVAVGIGILINALLVPILILATVVALCIFDRDLSWLGRLRPIVGAPIALMLGAPWLILRVHQDGVAFSGMSWRAFLGALGGAQDMKLRAFPSVFVLAMLLGFAPGTMLVGTALKRFWAARHDQRLPRFLLAWVNGYLVYLEALSSKPGIYMVQTMFPALALAVAMVVTSKHGEGKQLEWSGFWIWPMALAALPLAIFGAVYAFVSEVPSFFALILIAITTSLFIWTGQLGREGQLRRWVAVGISALGLFGFTLLGVVLPSVDKIWPARMIAKVIAACPKNEAILIGFREPSGRFLLNIPPERQTPDALADRAAAKTPILSIVEDRWAKRTNWTLQSKSQDRLPPQPTGCISAYNVMRGCPLHFRVYLSNSSELCAIPAEFACSDKAAPIWFEKSGDCN